MKVTLKKVWKEMQSLDKEHLFGFLNTDKKTVILANNQLLYSTTEGYNEFIIPNDVEKQQYLPINVTDITKREILIKDLNYLNRYKIPAIEKYLDNSNNKPITICNNLEDISKKSIIFYKKNCSKPFRQKNIYFRFADDQPLCCKKNAIKFINSESFNKITANNNYINYILLEGKNIQMVLACVKEDNSFMFTYNANKSEIENMKRYNAIK